MTRQLNGHGIQPDDTRRIDKLPTRSCESVPYTVGFMPDAGWQIYQREYRPLIPGVNWKPLLGDEDAYLKLNELAARYGPGTGASVRPSLETGSCSWWLFNDRMAFKSKASSWPVADPAPRLSRLLRVVVEEFWALGWMPLVVQRLPEQEEPDPFRREFRERTRPIPASSP